MHVPKSILVATDFSAAADAALDQALVLAAKLDAKVHLLHAYQLPIDFRGGVFVPSAEIAAQIMTAAQADLASAIAKRKDSPVEIRPILKQADPREAVLLTAAEVSADLIIMGTHGRKGIARALIGSVAEAIVRASPVPVMTVHAAHA